MTNPATMIIRTGFNLEFVHQGKSLGKFHCQNAKAVLSDVKKAKKDEVLHFQRIQNYYEQLSSHEEVITPAGNSAGFERVAL